MKAKKNILLSFVFKAGTILINLAIIPLTINLVSASEYGVWITLTSLIAWFNLFDIGFGHGLRNKFASAVAEDKTELAQTYVSTTYAFLSMLIIGIWSIFFVLNRFVDWSLLLNVDEGLRQQLSRVALIVFTFFSIQFVLRLLGTILTANQEPAKTAGFTFISNLFILASIYLLVGSHRQSSLEDLAWITGIFQILVFIIASFWYYRRGLKRYRPTFSKINFAYIRPLMGLGVKFFVIQFAAIFVFESTNLIITQLLGPNQVTIYSIAYRYYSIPMAIAMIVALPLWSAFTDAYTRHDYTWMQHVHRRLSLLLLGIVGLLVCLFLVSPFAFRIWIGSQIVIPRVVSLLMMVNLILSTVFVSLIVIVNGMGKIKLQLIVYSVFGILFVPAAILMGKQAGLPGIIAVNIVVNGIFATFVYIQSKKLVYRQATGIWGK